MNPDEYSRSSVRHTLYKAMFAKDPRFDGRFFVGVQTTGVFCRPICPSRTPRLENCVFFQDAPSAYGAGFRPCRRCRPDASPGTPAWSGTLATVNRALRLIAQGALDNQPVSVLAERLGVGERHLRRLFICHLGTTPRAVAQFRRTELARNLIKETSMTMRSIATASGFQSLRRFNDAVHNAFEASPTEMRRLSNKHTQCNVDGLALRLPYRGPYDWDHTLAYLEQSAIDGVEAVHSSSYRRIIDIGGVIGRLVVTCPQNGRGYLLAQIDHVDLASLPVIAARITRMFDLAIDSSALTRSLEAFPLVGRFARQFSGMRIPGAWDLFEITVQAIVSEQEPPENARSLMRSLACEYGRRIADIGEGSEPTYAFPSPLTLATADISGCGIAGDKAERIRRAATLMSKEDALSNFSSDFATELLRQCGLSEDAAQYVAMRGLSESDALPIRALASLSRGGSAGEATDEPDLRQIAESWHPWRAYAAMVVCRANQACGGKWQLRRECQNTERTYRTVAAADSGPEPPRTIEAHPIGGKGYLRCAVTGKKGLRKPQIEGECDNGHPIRDSRHGAA
jgi:AraC family transcriptional regulator of adaptative response / DNA-3-methyladenine glycosylase II